MINIEGVFNNEERQNYSTIDPKTEDFFADRPVIENYKEFYGLRSINFLVDYLIITDDNTIRFYLNKNIDTLSKLIKTEYAFTDTITNKIFAEFNDSKFASSRNKHGVTISYKFPAEIYNNVDRLYLKMKIKIYNTDTLYSEAKRIVDWYENPYHKTLENIGFFSHSQTKTSTSLSKCVVDIDTTLPIEHIQNCYPEIIGGKYAYTDSKSYIYRDTGIFFVNVEPLLMFIDCNVFVRYRIYFLSPKESDYKVTHKKFLRKFRLFRLSPPERMAITGSGPWRQCHGVLFGLTLNSRPNRIAPFGSPNRGCHSFEYQTGSRPSYPSTAINATGCTSAE